MIGITDNSAMNMNKRFFNLGLLIAGLASSSCENELQEEMVTGLMEKTPLSIQVAAGQVEDASTKALVEGNSLPVGSEIGLRVVQAGKSTYDGTTYENGKSSFDGTKWNVASDVLLSATPGTVYAYYPHNSSLANPEAIAMTASTAPGGGTDYMYATTNSVSQKAPTAALTMKHALTAVKVSIQKGTYQGAGKVTALTWTSDGAGTGGSLNAKTGAVSSVTGTGTAFNAGLTAESSYTITTTAKDYTFMAVPAGTSKALSFSVTLDGQTFTVNSAAVTLGQGKLHQYILTMDAKTMTVSKVTLTDWANQTEEGLKPSF